MRRHRLRTFVLGGVALFIAAVAGVGEARSLRDRLLAVADPTGTTIDAGAITVTIPATLHLDYISPLVSRTALRAVDRPVTAAAPSFLYVYDPQADGFRRERLLAPVFADRATTIGAGHVEIGATLDWADLDRVDGGGFGDAVGLTRTDLSGTKYILLQRVRVDDFRLSTLSVVSHVTVGITDRLDLSLLAPLVWNHMAVDLRQRFALYDDSAQLLSRTPFARRRTRGDATGIGDLQARAKLMLWGGETMRLATTLTVRMPTGDTANFQGLGDTVVTPGLTTSVRAGFAEVNAGLGLDLNADDPERTRVRYVLGSTVPVREWVSLVLEIIGSSALSDDRFAVPGVLRTVNGVEIVSVDPVKSRTVLAIPRSDVVDLALTGKFSLGSAGSLFLGVLVPLTHDGLRSAVTPIVGVDVSF